MGEFAYLRPTKDISIQHTIQGSNYAYDVLDDESTNTYIYISSNKNMVKTSSVTISGIIPNIKNGYIKSAKLHMSTSRTGSKTMTFNSTIKINSSTANKYTYTSSWTETVFDLDISLFTLGSNSLTCTISDNVSSQQGNPGDVRIAYVYIEVEYDADYTITTTCTNTGGSAVSPIVIPWKGTGGPQITVNSGSSLVQVIMDSTTNVTGRMEFVDPYYTYTIENIDDDHTFTVTFGSTSLFTKVNGNWVLAKGIYEKINNIWVKSDSPISMFDEDRLYINEILD